MKWAIKCGDYYVTSIGPCMVRSCEPSKAYLFDDADAAQEWGKRVFNDFTLEGVDE